MTDFTVRDELRNSVDRWAFMGHPAVGERFVLRNGREFAGAKLPKGFKRGKMKECFSNAADLVNRKNGLRYVEGYMYRAGLPILILHAWAIDANDTVIDVTLDRPEECKYMGVVLSRKELWAEIQKLGHYGLIDTGLGLNADWMFRLDPDLKAEIAGVNRDKWDAMIAANTPKEA